MVLAERQSQTAEQPEAVQAVEEVDKDTEGAIEGVAYPLSDGERDLIAATCFYEARGEGSAGMEAVAQVILNRLIDGRFGSTVDDVCTPDQFHGLRYLGSLEITEDAYEAVRLIFDAGQGGKVNGALYFCTGDPAAIKTGLVQVAKIGKHTFYAD